MMIRPLSCVRVALLLLPLFGLACEVVVNGKGSKPAAKNNPPQTVAAGEPYGDPPNWDSRPSFKVAISDIIVNWPDNQQTFKLTLTNTGDNLERVHAIVYATNEGINPPPPPPSRRKRRSTGFRCAAVPTANCRRTTSNETGRTTLSSAPAAAV